MADLAASDVTVVILNKRRVEARNFFNVSLAFGDGALTYPAGGIPLSKANLGCPNVIESLRVYGKGTSGYEFSYDAANEKLVMIQAPAQTHSHNLLLKDAAVADGATTRVNAGTNLLGANTGSDISVAGGGANGGVASATLAAAAGTQPSAVAIAAQSIRAEVIGW